LQPASQAWIPACPAVCPGVCQATGYPGPERPGLRPQSTGQAAPGRCCATSRAVACPAAPRPGGHAHQPCSMSRPPLAAAQDLQRPRPARIPSGFPGSPPPGDRLEGWPRPSRRLPGNHAFMGVQPGCALRCTPAERTSPADGAGGGEGYDSGSHRELDDAAHRCRRLSPLPGSGADGCRYARTRRYQAAASPGVNVP